MSRSAAAPWRRVAPVIAVALASAGAACGPEVPPSVGVSSAAPSASASATSIVDDDPGIFPSKRFGLRVPLEEGDAWRIDDHKTPWLTAQKPKDQSSLMLRVWRGENRMNRDKCEAIARGWKSLPVRDKATLVSHEPLDFPEGFDTYVDVGLVPAPEQSALFGFVLAFGGYAHKCFAYVFVTKDQGPGADERVAERLGTNVERTLKKIRIVSDLEPEIDRAPPAD
ncbi:MAG: hypothetical protein U0414_17795 [Polyangiaceae bacterium]